MRDPSELKVCFVAGTLGQGGAERQLVYMLRALSSAGVQSRVLCLTRGEFFQREIEKLGVRVEWFGASESRFNRLTRLINALRREPADIVQSVHFYTNLYVAIAGRIVGVRSIGAIRNDVVSELAANGLLGWGHLKLPEHLIANSTLGKDRAIEKGRGPDRVHLLENAVGRELFANNGNGNGSGNGHSALRILFVGRLDQQKRPDLFLRVAARVVQQMPNHHVKAVMVGDGVMKTHVTQLAPTLGLDSEHLDFVTEHADIGSVYRKSDLLMLTSDWEGTPNVLLEAMAAGLPVAATRVGGVPEIVGDDRGILVEPGDENALTNAALRLLKDKDLRGRLGQCGKDYVTRFHSLEALQSNLLNIYQTVAPFTHPVGAFSR